MPYPSRTIGNLSAQAINIGDITLPLAPNMRGPASSRAEVLKAISGQTIVPMQDLLVRGGRTNILVDAGSYDIDGSSGYSIAGYRAPASLQDQLASIGVPRESIGHVVMTHSHWDHFQRRHDA
ncbi:MBL fold metallo-hydrolase [Pseudochelatococcus sp. B33]